MAWRVAGPLTVPPDVEAVGGLQLADVVAGGDVQAVDAGGGEDVIQTQRVSVQSGQRAAHRCVRHAVGQETPAHPHGGAGNVHTHTHTRIDKEKQTRTDRFSLIINIVMIIFFT